ncbi:MAG: hypothetical protein PWP46_94 [Fusobacteriaceae bacterium]|jgi:hypothetical protein|nr:ATPase [Fusobacteriales bacterium]MDN5303215.1 hypothetical protein [Fusobacteriaceae bacterium]
MDKDIKIVIKNSFITSLIILIYGLLIQNKIVYIGFFLGSLFSIFAFYLIYRDVKYIMITKNGSYKNAILGYFKRYVLYLIFLVLMIKIDFSYFIAASLGLLNVKFNILLKNLFIDFLKKFKSKFDDGKEGEKY